MERKTMWNHHLIIGLISITLGISCKKTDNQKLADYIYCNPTSHNIAIKCFFKGIDSTYSLERYDTIILSEDLMAGSTFKIVHTDSVSIIYDSERRQFYLPNTTSERNILRLSNYDYNQIATNHFVYKFVFSEEDYNNALIIKK